MTDDFLLHTFYFLVVLAFLLFQKKRIDEERAVVEQLKIELELKLDGETK